MGLLHEVPSAVSRDDVNATVGFGVLPAAIRLRIALERKALRVVYIPEFQVVVVLKTVWCSPSCTEVVTIVVVRESMELRND